jgi:long-subunit fatty acid transport protein
MSSGARARGASIAAALLRCCAVLAFTVFPHHAAHSRGIDFINRTVDFDDFGFTRLLDVGARPAGLAGAYAAAGNDVHTLIYNPAGLARIKRIELSLGLQQQFNRAENVYYGNPSSISTRDGGFDGAALAWPVPAYRGSLVPAFGMYRIFSSVVDLRLSGVDAQANTYNHLLQQTGSTYSYNFGLGVELSPALSGGLSFFVLDGSVDILRQSNYTYDDRGSRTTVFLKEDVTADLTGVGGRIGVQFFLHRWFVFGASFTPPIWANVKGDSTAERTQYWDNRPDSLGWMAVRIDDDYLLPFRIDLGIAFTPGRFVFEFDLGYSDWTEASLNGKRFRNPESLETTFREVFDLKFGAEYTFLRLPLRARAGYAYLPYPLAYLQSDRIDKNELTPVEIDRERQQIAMGVGGLFGEVLTVDASFSITTGKRSTISLTDESTSYRFVLSAAYRF